MEFNLLSFVINGLLGAVMFFMKTIIDTQREDLKDIKAEIVDIKDKYLKKDDFKDFKEELWNRLDRFETDIKRQLGSR